MVRLFIGGLPGFPKDKPHSFTIKLDGSDIEPQIEKEMKDHRPKDIPPRHPPAKTPTDVHGDAIEAIDKELTKDLTYVGGTRRKSAGPTNHNKSLNKSKSQKKQNKRISGAGARVPNSGPIIPPGIGGIPSTGNPYEPLAGLGANKDQPPLERRTTGRDRLRRKSLD